jgi:hypothetical protein
VVFVLLAMHGSAPNASNNSIIYTIPEIMSFDDLIHF